MTFDRYSTGQLIHSIPSDMREPPPRREPERWELYTRWLWVKWRGVWHVATDVTLNAVSREYFAYRACGGHGVVMLAPVATTGYHLKNTEGGKFCRECRRWINAQLDAMGVEK